MNKEVRGGVTQVIPGSPRGGRAPPRLTIKAPRPSLMERHPQEKAQQRVLPFVKMARYKPEMFSIYTPFIPT